MLQTTSLSEGLELSEQFGATLSLSANDNDFYGCSFVIALGIGSWQKMD